MNKARILIVEDEEDIRKILVSKLEASGYEVFQASDGDVAFTIAQEAHPDLIVADVIMPKSDGNQLLKKLRTSASGKNIPFIVMTGRPNMKDYFEMMRVDAFIIKPFQPQDLLVEVAKVLEQKGKSILILENDNRRRHNLQETFDNYGYITKVVVSVSECLEEAVLFHPDLIIARYYFTGMSGDKIVDLLRGMSSLQGTPILVYSESMLGNEKVNVLKAHDTYILDAVDTNGVKLLKEANTILHNGNGQH